MKLILRKGLMLSLALALMASPFQASTAEAGRKYKGRGQRQAPAHRERHDGRHQAPVYRERHHYRSHRHNHSNAVIPFLGGVALGAIISRDRPYCPPPRVVVHRRYVYDCDYHYCDYSCLDYDAWVEHLIVVHHVPACDIDRNYSPYNGGYWEEY